MCTAVLEGVTCVQLGKGRVTHFDRNPRRHQSINSENISEYIVGQVLLKCCSWGRLPSHHPSAVAQWHTNAALVLPVWTMTLIHEINNPCTAARKSLLIFIKLHMDDPCLLRSVFNDRSNSAGLAKCSASLRQSRACQNTPC